MATDTLVILTGDKPSAKSVYFDQQGLIRIKRAGSSWMHSVEALRVQSLDDIYSAMLELQHQKNRFVVRGRLVSGRPDRECPTFCV